MSDSSRVTSFTDRHLQTHVGVITRSKPKTATVDTVNEAGVPGYSMTNWNGVVAPSGLPASLAARLVADVTQIMKEPRTQEKVAALGAEIEILAGEDFERKMRQEVAAWTQVVKATGIKPD